MKRGNKLLKLLDRFLGIPIVIFLGLFVKKMNPPKQFKSIALLKTAAIGDTVLISAIAKDIKAAFPEVKIALIVGSSNAPISKFIPKIDNIIFIESVTNVFSLSSIPKMDILINFGQWPRLDALIGHFANANFKIGFKTVGQYNHSLNNWSVVHSNTVHELENFRNLIRVIGINPTQQPELSYKSTNKSSDLISIGNYIVIHPWISGYKSELKQWSLANWKLLITRISEVFDLRILISGGKDDKIKSEKLIEFIGLTKEKVQNISGEFSLGEMSHILLNAKLLVSVNTGIMHMGAALGTPTIGLSGPTNPKRWGPIGPNAISISPENPACGYLNLGFEHSLKTVDCMSQITVVEVFEKCREVLEKSAPSNNK